MNKPKNIMLVGRSKSINAIDILGRLSTWLNKEGTPDECFPLGRMYRGEFQVLLEYGNQQFAALVGADSEGECKEIIEDLRYNIPTFALCEAPSFFRKPECFTYGKTSVLKENYFDQFFEDLNEATA